jgi:alpha-glucuronidase
MPDPLSRRAFLRAGGLSLAATAAATALATSPQAAAAARLLTAEEPAAEDGYELWLRYRLVQNLDRLTDYRSRLAEVVVQEQEPRVRSAVAELDRALPALLGRQVPTTTTPSDRPGAVVGTWSGSAAVRELVSRGDVERVGPDGYLLRSVRQAGVDRIVVAGNTGQGVLTGTFALLRRLQRHQALDRLDESERPAAPLRLVNHWDNLNGTVERGYAGRSIFRWDELPELDPRYTDYARALASLGINGTVVNNVNANPAFLSTDMIRRLAPLADLLRAWGVRLYLSANFAAPLALGELDTADPLDGRVQDWWKRKANEIVTSIPDFGGFLVKANSEGQPGPAEYGRTHAEGANTLARAVAPHGGVVMWRAFVYDASDGDVSTDAYNTFKPLDGAFDDNVVLQAKYGPVDFHVREPVHPLFGAMPETNMMIELQITQEHTGQDTDLCYLPTWWRQVLDFDTYAKGPGTTVATVIDGSAFGYSHCGSAGVMNFGDDRNWTGTHLAAANTHGYGRLLWNPAQRPQDLAAEWAELTFSPKPEVVAPLTEMLLGSWKTFEDYTSPLGVGNMVDPAGDHYTADPVASQPAHRADAEGVGFDRTVATGTGFTGLYHQPWARVYESLALCPDELLLFMHHVPYEHPLRSGRTVLDHIYETHFAGLEKVLGYRETWRGFVGKVDAQRYAEQQTTFDRHVAHARSWRDAVVGYFFELSRMLATTRSWVQVKVRSSDRLLLGGWPTRLPITLGNASPDTLRLSAGLQADAAWTVRPDSVTVESRQFEKAVPRVVPPTAGLSVSRDVDLDTGGLPVIGGTGVEFAVTPAPSLCHLALDAGPDGAPLFPGYQRLTPQHTWTSGATYGWVGTSPQSRDRGGPDELRRDFCNDAAPRTLRVAVPAGQHQAYVLVGDQAVGSEPTAVSVGGSEVARSSRLRGGEYAWLRFTLDGGLTGRTVDLTLSSVAGAHWHLNAFAVVDATASPPDVEIGDVTPSAALALPAEPVELRFWLYNFTDSDVTVTPTVTAPEGYDASTGAAEVTVPGGGDTDFVVTVTRRPGTDRAGSLEVSLGEDQRSVPLEPTDNWMRIAELSASSTHAPSSVTTLNDGSTDSELWGPGGANGWNDGTPQVFPDTVTATWDHAVPLGRLRVHTLNSRAYPASAYGVRDYDVELRVDGAWRTVVSVRGNTTGVVESRFPAADADALRLVVLDSNDHAYSRLIELEAFSS